MKVCAKYMWIKKQNPIIFQMGNHMSFWKENLMHILLLTLIIESMFNSHAKWLGSFAK